jgi:pyruvate kinase
MPNMEISFPQGTIVTKIIDEKDQEDITKFAIPRGVDLLAVSGVRSSRDIDIVRSFLKENGGDHIKLIAKIQNTQAFMNYQSILKTSDITMVCRDRLGQEMVGDKLVLAQKWMIEESNREMKPVIVSGHMFNSMINNSKPTSAECSDVANICLDGADCLTLHAETAIGSHPVESIRYLAKSICESEKAREPERHGFGEAQEYSRTHEDPNANGRLTLYHAALHALDYGSDLIIAFTDWEGARILSKCRPQSLIIACT